MFQKDVEHKDEVHKLYDPNQTSKVVGEITLGYSAEVNNLMFICNNIILFPDDGFDMDSFLCTIADTS